MPLDTSGSVRKRLESEEVFLSPRVVDEVAFEDFAARLKREIDRASGETKGLRGLLEEVQGAGKTLELMTERHRTQSEESNALAEEITAQRALVQEMLGGVAEYSEKQQRFEQRVDDVLAHREMELSQRVDAALERFDGTMGAAAAQAIEAVDGRVSRVEGQIERTLAKFEQTLETRLTQSISNAEARIEQCVSQATEQLADVETARAALEQQVDKVVGSALDALRLECDRAERLLNGANDGDSLRNVLENAGEVADRLDEALESATQSEDRLATSFNGINERVDEASRRYVALEESLRKAIKASNSTEKLLAARTDDVKNISTALDAARARADQAILSLQRNATHAEKSAAGGKAKQDRLDATVKQANQVLASLEPWRGVLLEHSVTRKLPDEIEQVVRRVRQSVLKEYMKGGKHAKPIGEQVEFKQDPTQSAPTEQTPPAV